MKTVQLLIAAIALLAASCRDTALLPQMPPDYSGLYSDTFTFLGTPLLGVTDTVIDKRLYKMNDSTYLMQRFTCLDTVSSTGCGLFPAYNSTSGNVYAFTVRAGNTLKFYNYSLVPAIPITIGFFVPPDYFYIKYIYTNRTEIHKMRKR
jgi:hypothetical protein